MKIKIERNTTIGDIQKAFNREFPLLSLRFFDARAAKENMFARKFLITDTSLSVAEAGRYSGDGEVDIRGSVKTGELEQDFRDHFGLLAQVFRKAGLQWIETSSTDDHTLDEQNRNAGQSVYNIAEESPDADAYHEQE